MALRHSGGSEARRSKAQPQDDPWGGRLEFLQEHGQHLDNCSCEDVKRQLRERRDLVESEYMALRAERDQLRMTLHDVVNNFGPNEVRLTLDQRASLNKASASLKGKETPSGK